MAETCGICRDEFGDLPKHQLECHKDHCFHSACINKWIVESKVEQAECPICRKKIFPQKEKEVQVQSTNILEIQFRDLFYWKLVILSLISDAFGTWSAYNPFSLVLILVHQFVRKKVFNLRWVQCIGNFIFKVLYRFYFCKYFNFNLEIFLIWTPFFAKFLIMIIVFGYKLIKKIF